MLLMSEIVVSLPAAGSTAVNRTDDGVYCWLGEKPLSPGDHFQMPLLLMDDRIVISTKTGLFSGWFLRYKGEGADRTISGQIQGYLDNLTVGEVQEAALALRQVD